MAQTSWGFDGTINEAQWSEMAGLLGNGYVAADASSCITTAVGGARKVSVSAGTLYGDGIVTVLDAAEEVTLTTPANGQWYVVALRREWAGNTTSLVSVAGATTTTTTPTAPPSTLPTLNADPGVITDQPIAWAWANSANTTVVVYDMRQFPVRRMPLTVANNFVRDGIFQTPTQGQQVWRNDLGAVETYYGAYNAISNPGGRDSAGWYLTDRAGGLVPIQPTSAVIATGSGSANALGVVSFTGATSVILNNVFSSNYRNYRVTLNLIGVSTTLAVSGQLTSNGTALAGTAYNRAGFYVNSAGGTGTVTGTNSNLFFIIGSASSANNTATAFVDIQNPAVSNRKTVQSLATGYAGSSYEGSFLHAMIMDTGTYDGLRIAATAGNFSGFVQVFGYND